MFEDLFIYRLSEKIADDVESFRYVAVDGLRELLLKLVDRVSDGGVEKHDDNIYVVTARAVRVVKKRIDADVNVSKRRVRVYGSVEYELASGIMVWMRTSGNITDVELRVVYESTRGGHIGLFAKLQIVGNDVCGVENPRSDGNVHIIGPMVIDKGNEEVKICGKQLDYDESGVELKEVRYLYAWEWEDVRKALRL